jgi:2-polyprenyl-3-methyl-5-hydroxy-6-metoxy-1,4-benzoquinol methylase
MPGDPSELDGELENRNDRLAREHSIDDYYVNSPLPIRIIERRRLGIIRAFMGDVTGMDVLEVGSGGGHVLRMFPRASLTALDVSDAFLEMARRNLEGLDVRYLKGEVEKLELPPMSYDRIICTEVLEHTTSPEAILAAIATLLRPSGVAVITVPNDPLIRRLKRAARRVGWKRGVEWGGDEFHLHEWAPSEFKSLLGRHLLITEQRGAPLGLLPVRACFRCVIRDEK